MSPLGPNRLITIDVERDEEFQLLRGLQCGVSVLQARQTDAVRIRYRSALKPLPLLYGPISPSIPSSADTVPQSTL